MITVGILLIFIGDFKMGDPTILKTILYVLGAGFLGYVLYLIYDYIKSMKKSPREVWFLFGSQTFEVVAYTLVDVTVVLFLSKDIGLSDIAAGNYIGVWTTATVVATFLIGSLVDAVGVRRILYMGTLVTLIARFFLFSTTNYWLLTILSFAPMAVSLAMLGPVIAVAIKKFTTSESSVMGFGLYMTILHVMAAVAYWIFDKVRQGLGEEGVTNLPFFGETSTYRMILLICFALSIPSFLFILFMRKGVELTDDEKVVIHEDKKDKSAGFFSSLIDTTKDSATDALKVFLKVVGQKAFWKFMLLIGILFGVKFVFFHFAYTFPKYGIRLYGKGAPIGTLFGVLHAILITVLIPFTTSITKKVKAYTMLTIGTFISAFSVFILTMPEVTFTSLVDTAFGKLIWQEWLHADASTAPIILGSYIAVAVTVTVFTIGESIWAPRLMEYTMQVAPEGQEGSYMSLSMLPLFIARPLVGIMSGALLGKYCPGPVAPDQIAASPHATIWFWIGITALISPVGLVVFRKFMMADKGAHA